MGTQRGNGVRGRAQNFDTVGFHMAGFATQHPGPYLLSRQGSGDEDYRAVLSLRPGDAAPVMAQRQDVAGKSFLRGIVHFAVLPYSGRALSQGAGNCNITGKRAHCQGRKGRRFRQERAEPRKTFM